MKVNRFSRNSAVAALVAIFTLCLPAIGAQATENARLDQLFSTLKQAEQIEAEKIAREIELEFSKSGSATMDLLLKRGRDALAIGRMREAIGHLTALTDHAPDFAEGFYYRALAYFQAGMVGPSFADVEQVLALNPRHFGAIALLGVLMEDMERPDMAQEAYRRVLDLYPGHKDAKEALTRLAPQLGDQEL
mgnify:CR=1 FL=1